ncbi:hypothetical protein BG004_006395 [Podila humilis]|nr:hypothetical protein BG004_006395 [Podila humilis]
MGVKGLTGLLRQLAPAALHLNTIEYYRGKTLAVDISCFLNKFVYGLDPHPARVQKGVYKLCLLFQNHGIKPIFVFDGSERIIEKHQEGLRRAAQKEKVAQSFELEKRRRSRLATLKTSSRLLQDYSHSSRSITSFITDTQQPLQDPAPVHPANTAIHRNHNGVISKVPDSNDDSIALDDPHKMMIKTTVTNKLIAKSIAMNKFEATAEKILLLECNLLDHHLLLDSIGHDPVDIGLSWNETLLDSPEYQSQLQQVLTTSKEYLAHHHHNELPMPLHQLELETAFFSVLLDDADRDILMEGYLTFLAENGRGLDPIKKHYALGQEQSIQQYVHQALDTFVQRLESENQNPEEIHALSNQRQRALNQLELELVQEIKGTLYHLAAPACSTFTKSTQDAIVSESESILEEKQLSSRGNVFFPGQENENGLRKPNVGQVTEHQDEIGLDQDISNAHQELELELELELEQALQKVDILADRDHWHDGMTSPDQAQGRVQSAMQEEVQTLTHEQGQTLTQEQGQTLTQEQAQTLTQEQAQAEAISWKEEKEANDDDENEKENETDEKENESLPERQEEKEEEEEEERAREQTLPEMVHNVLATHQTLFMTLERRSMRVTRSLELLCQELLEAMGMPVMEAEGAEAEAVCAHLVTIGVADATVSEDTDTVVFGDGLLLRQVGVSKKAVLEINPVVARESLGLSRDAFRDVCILCGTDFSGTIEGIGRSRAVKLIQQYGSIESVMANTAYSPRPTFVYDNARRVFDRRVSVPGDASQFQAKSPVQPHLDNLLKRYGISPEEVQLELVAEEKEEGTE